MIQLPALLERSVQRAGDDLAILVVRLGALGDILRTLPPVRLLRRGLPRARIVWVVDDRWESVLEGHPDLDGVLSMPRRHWRSIVGAPRRWPELIRSIACFRSRLRAVDARLLLDFHGNLRSAITGRLSGATVRLGYGGHQAKEGNRWLTTHRVPAGSRRTPRMERNLDLIRALGLPDAPLPHGALPMVARGRGEADAVRSGLGAEAYAVLSPGASSRQAAKKPPASLLAAACDRLWERGVRPLVVWGPGERTDAEAVVERCGERATLAPPTDLPTLAALLATARLFVGGDSGPLHLACAVDCPVVGLYGPTDPEVNRPWRVPYRVVQPVGREYTGIKRIDRRGGFEDLDPARVAEAVDSLLGDAAAPSSGR